MSLLLEPMTSWSIGSAHALGRSTRQKMLPKLPVGTANAQRPTRGGGGDVVDDLAAITRAQLIEFMADSRTAVAELGVGEQGLHQVLAVVEGALDGHVVHVGRVDGGHLAALHVAHPARGVEHDDVERGRPTQASMAAEPVSPEVATTMVARSPRGPARGRTGGRRAGGRRP